MYKVSGYHAAAYFRKQHCAPNMKNINSESKNTQYQCKNKRKMQMHYSETIGQQNNNINK